MMYGAAPRRRLRARLAASTARRGVYHECGGGQPMMGKKIALRPLYAVDVDLLVERVLLVAGGPFLYCRTLSPRRPGRPFF